LTVSIGISFNRKECHI